MALSRPRAVAIRRGRQAARLLRSELAPRLRRGRMWVLTPELQSQLERLRREMTTGDLTEDARYFRVIAGDEEVSVASSRASGQTVEDGLEARDITRTIGGE